MSEGRNTVVLFADISDSTRLYETVGDAAAIETIDRCIGLLREATGSVGGRVVKTIGDEVMAYFSKPDAANVAAANMQQSIDNQPMVAGIKLGLRVGFHYGPVMLRGEDVFGDTVNVAARLVKQANRGQIITSQDTVEMLNPVFRGWTRRLYAIPVKGKSAEIELWEVIWRQNVNVTSITSYGVAVKPKSISLSLSYGDVTRMLRRSPDSIDIGREVMPNGLIVSEPNASRQHCTITRRHDLFVLSDHSANGTFVTVEGDAEVMLRREEFTLRRTGWISLGQPRAEGGTCVEFSCD